MDYLVKVKGCLSIGGRKFAGGKVYSDKELGDISLLKGYVEAVGGEEEDKFEEDAMSVSELKEFIEGLSIEDLKQLLKEEKEGKNRKTAINLIENKIKDVQGSNE